MQRVKPYFGRYSIKALFEVNYCEPLELPEFQKDDDGNLIVEAANIKLPNDKTKHPNLNDLVAGHIREVLKPRFGESVSTLKLNVLTIELTKQSSAW